MPILSNSTTDFVHYSECATKVRIGDAEDEWRSHSVLGFSWPVETMRLGDNAFQDSANGPPVKASRGEP